MDDSPASAQEDDLIRAVFAITLDSEHADDSADPPIVHLSQLAQELKDESPGISLLLNRTNLERALMARLMEPPEGYPQWPVPYLLGSYGRASEKFRTLPNTATLGQLQSLLAYCKELSVSYTGLLLTMDMFPQPPEAKQWGALQLYLAIEARNQNSTSKVHMPLDFLGDFAARFEDEGLSDVVAAFGKHLARTLLSMSATAEFQDQLSVLLLISHTRPMARSFVALQEFLPKAVGNGRIFSTYTFLGSAFSLGIIPDRHADVKPDVRQQYFQNAESKPSTEIQSAISSLRFTVKQLAENLYKIVMNLLKKDTRERMVAWLCAAVESNKERSKTMANYKLASPDSFFMNLSAVCIRLCQPFIEPGPKAWSRIDARYVVQNDHIAFSEETKLSVSQEEEKAWLAERAASGDAATTSVPAYNFICESFFLTAKALHLGPVHLLQRRNNTAKQVQRLEQDAKHLEQMLHSMPEPQATLHRRQHQQIVAYIDKAKGEVILMDTHLQDPETLRDMLFYYRLMAAWLLHLVAPSAVGGDIQLPLPTPAPMAFCTLPEYFLEDMVEVLEWVAAAAPGSMDSVPSTEFVNLIIVFLGSPAYIKNAHLRARLVDLLHVWISPQLSQDNQLTHMRQAPAIIPLINLIEWHPLVQQNLLRGLLQLFVDIEHTDRHNTFFEKFTTRYKAGEILCYLWTIPAHREVWRKLAAEGGGRGIYLNFCDVMCNDAQYLLDDVIKTLPEVRQTEDLMADTAAWQALSQEERAEKEKHHAQNTHNLQADLYLASVYIRVMRTTTQDITLTWLLPEMVSRVASMTTYFLDHLAGKEKRKNLRVRDPEKYKWKPAELLAQLAFIFLHLSRADASGAFVAAIAQDERSYHEGLFSDAADVLRKYRLLGEEQVDELEALGERVQLARLSATAEEEALGDVPDEFLDPVTFDLMTDPVTLPRSGGGEAINMDRATITRHLLSNPYDPFNKQPLRADQLISNPELKARIADWKRSQRQRASGAEPMQE